MSEESGLSRHEIEALDEDAEAAEQGEGTAAVEMDARPDELRVRAQQPEDKS
jgi:hypothetical protein